MREIPKWLTKLIGRLPPTQTSSGNGSLQISKLDGDVTHVHFTQHIYAPLVPPARAPQAEPPSVRVSRPDRRASPRNSLATGQHLVLKLLDQVPDRISVLEFMAREFGTRMVVELDPKQLYRLQRYLEVVLAAKGVK